MKPHRLALTASLLAPLALVATGVSGHENHEHEHRQHGAHVHGIAALNLAVEGKDVHVELDSPAANIVGFEHAPASEADHAALDKAVATLKDGARLLRFNAEAACRMEQARLMSSLLDEGYGGHGDAHEGHDDHKKQHEHGHGRHGHDGHEHERETHADIEAVYHFECDHPDELTGLTVALFEAFPGTERLNVQYVVENKQGAAVLTPANPVIRF